MLHALSYCNTVADYGTANANSANYTTVTNYQ